MMRIEIFVAIKAYIAIMNMLFINIILINQIITYKSHIIYK